MQLCSAVPRRLQIRTSCTQLRRIACRAVGMRVDWEDSSAAVPRAQGARLSNRVTA